MKNLLFTIVSICFFNCCFSQIGINDLVEAFDNDYLENDSLLNSVNLDVYIPLVNDEYIDQYISTTKVLIYTYKWKEEESLYNFVYFDEAKLSLLRINAYLSQNQMGICKNYCKIYGTFYNDSKPVLENSESLVRCDSYRINGNIFHFYIAYDSKMDSNLSEAMQIIQIK